MRHICITALALAFSQWCIAQTGQVAGSIADARGGEALARVDVQLAGTAYRTRSDPQGHFQLDGVPPGDYVLNVSTVGYRLAKKPFHLEAGEGARFDIILSPGSLTQIDSVDVKAGPFEGPLVLAGNDVTN